MHLVRPHNIPGSVLADTEQMFSIPFLLKHLNNCTFFQMLDRQWATCRPRQNEPHKGLYFPRQFVSSISEVRLLPSSNLSSRNCQVDLQRSNLWQRVLACGLIVIVALSTLQASLSHHCQPSEGSWPSSSSLARRPPSSPLPLPTTHQPSSLTTKHFQNSLISWKG